MKKILIIMISLIVIACWLPACNKQSEEKSGYLPEQQMSKILNGATAPFKMTTSMFLTDGCGNENGFYSLKNNNDTDIDDTSRNILYIDYETKKQMYLCAQPSCAHDDESCTSWLAPGEGGAFLALAGDKLLLIYNTSQPRIDVMDINGANKKNLCRFGNGIQIGMTIAFNGQHLVLSADKYWTDETTGYVKYAQTLCAIDIETGEQITIYEHEPETIDPLLAGYSYLHFNGVTDTGFIMVTETMGEYEVADDPNITFENMQKATKYEVFNIPFNGEDVKALITYTGDEPCEVRAIGQYLYFIRSSGSTVKLHRMDTGTGDTTTLIDFSDTETGIVPETFDVLHINPNCVKNKLILTYRVPQIREDTLYTTYSVDIETGELQEIALSLYYYMTHRPLQILAEVGDNLLVFGKAEEIDDGRAMPYVKLTPAFISKEDYLASNPNFDFIDAVY